MFIKGKHKNNINVYVGGNGERNVVIFSECATMYHLKRIKYSHLQWHTSIVPDTREDEVE